MKWTPCAPGDPAGRPMTLMDVPPAELHVPSITYYDFEKAIAHSRPSVSESMFPGSLASTLFGSKQVLTVRPFVCNPFHPLL